MTREYLGAQVPTQCVICGGDLEWERAETSSSEDVVMAEAYDPLGYEAHLAGFAASDEGPTAYEAWEMKGKAGVVHAACMEAKGWAMS
jgi:hypothetical protein